MTGLGNVKSPKDILLDSITSDLRLLLKMMSVIGQLTSLAHRFMVSHNSEPLEPVDTADLTTLKVLYLVASIHMKDGVAGWHSDMMKGISMKKECYFWYFTFKEETYYFVPREGVNFAYNPNQ